VSRQVAEKAVFWYDKFMKEKIKKKSKKITYVTMTEHKKWHKENDSCGSGKEHEACMKKWGIVIKKIKSKIVKK